MIKLFKKPAARWSAVAGGAVVVAFAVIALTQSRTPQQPAAKHSSQSTTLPVATSSSSLSATTSPALSTVFFLDAQHGWTGGKGTILRTGNGGATWTRTHSSTGDVSQIDFVTVLDGWAVASDQLLGTTDGGVNWTPLGEPTSPLTDVSFANTTVGWGVSSAGLVATDDAGQSWHAVSTPFPAQPATSPPYPGYESACLSSPEVGWVTAANSIVGTTDGGKSWGTVYQAPIKSGSGEMLTTIHCAPSGAAWAMLQGPGAAMQQAYLALRTSGPNSPWTVELALPSMAPLYYPTVHVQQSIDSYSGPFSALNAQTAFFLGNCPACGAGTTSLTYTSDAGQTWHHIQTLALGDHAVAQNGAATIDNLAAISFVSTLQGWLTDTPTGRGGYVFATTDGGQTWKQQYPPAG